MEPLALHAVHESLGATFGEAQGREVVSRYGALRDEHAAARLNACLFDFSFRQTLRLTGEDRIGFLQGMVTNDVKGLAEGDAAYSAMVTAKGALVADMRILRRTDDLLLDLEPGSAALVQQFLGKYLVSEEVEISDATAHFALLRLLGPEVHRIAAAAFGHETPLPSRDHFTQIEFDSHPAWLIGVEIGSNHGVDLLVSREHLTGAFGRTLHTRETLGLRLAGFDTFEILRVEAGLPRFPQDMDEQTIPLEANLERAISYEKGCYIGQEVIARATFRGHVNRKLIGLGFGAAEPPRNAELRNNGKRVGFITSAVRAPARVGMIGLGYVHRDSLEPGTQLEVVDYPPGAIVHALPFVDSSPPEDAA
ncbi:MAG TPA: glycine cleavage T C-terminal barrel domain-containing protein [Myxococcaceae bacterium]|nr:glycine cleavage T C-terminal barrel domain-containing protein [Myxococcaceae bacterium]